jgi:hypothetical protein
MTSLLLGAESAARHETAKWLMAMKAIATIDVAA